MPIYVYRYHLTEVPDGNYGMLLNQSTMEFNGLIGQIQRGVRRFCIMVFSYSCLGTLV